MQQSLCVGLFAFPLLLLALPLQAAELVTLRAATWDEYAPRGKEVDCIYGDFVLRNDRLVAVIARPVAGRNANMTVRNVGGCIIDLARTERQSDQLSAYYPGGSRMAWRSARTGGPEALDLERAAVRAGSVSLVCAAEASPAGDSAALAAAQVRYTLEDGWDYVLVETTWSNPLDQALQLAPADEVRADMSFEKAPDGQTPLFWAYDKWFGQAYGLVCEGHTLACTSDARTSTLQYFVDGKTSVVLEPGQTHRLARRVFPGADLLAVKGVANALAGLRQERVAIEVRDTAGNPLADADVLVKQGETLYGAGRTDAAGTLDFDLPDGSFEASVSALGTGSLVLTLAGGAQRVELPEPGYVVAEVSDEGGGPIPCKVQFRGRDGTEDPYFGHMTGERAVHNLYYSASGRFRQALAPGKYDVIASHGPEHDAVFTQIEIGRGRETRLEAVLVRSVQTPGWVSSDFHSHSSPSGDNTASQLGRVLNLLCEQIDFAPCTEHNRLSTYDPHLERLGAKHLMATCVGIELTGDPGDVNHQNAFPLVRQPRTQDDGAPQTDADPEVQIERLALWDGGSDKLVQQNHPDIGHVFFDRDGDGQPDGGFKKSLDSMDVIEVHPPHMIFEAAARTSAGQARNNTIVNWLQLLNQGHRLPGVVNTDAHYNFHGSGFLRIYLASPSDDPARIETLEMVHAAENGHVVMTSGPFLEVLLAAAEAGDHSQGTAGDDVVAPGGKAALRVRVQCPNWLDIDRVQVLLNGRPDEKLNFTRAATPGRFTGGVVKFDQELPLELGADAHVIVVAAGEKSTLGPVMGPEHGNDMPIAVSNPIYVDVDGGGFQPNGDTLGAPLPVMAGRRAN